MARSHSDSSLEDNVANAVVYLTRRNLLTLLSKLDRVKQGEVSACTIVKQDTTHTAYPCTHITYVRAVEDEDYYTDRKPGEVLEVDEPTVLAPEDAEEDLIDPEIEDAANNHGQDRSKWLPGYF
jgi:DNA-directed RNA polymerase subunit K/omega